MKKDDRVWLTRLGHEKMRRISAVSTFWFYWFVSQKNLRWTAYVLKWGDTMYTHTQDLLCSFCNQTAAQYSTEVLTSSAFCSVKYFVCVYLSANV